MVSLALAVFAAGVFAVAGALQHAAARTLSVRAVARVAPDHREWLPVLRHLSRLVRTPIWLAGFTANVVGFLLHAAALHTGSITVVQAILVSQLLMALPLASLRTGQGPLRRDWLGTLAVCVGISSLVLLHGVPTPGDGSTRTAVPVMAGAAVAVMATLVSVARLAHGHAQTRTALVGVAAGTGFSVTAALTVVLTGTIARNGLFAGLTSWPAFALAASAITSGILVQDAFASGSLPTALTAMTITDPVASWVWGAVVFDAAPPTGVWTLLGYAGCGLLIATGVVTLAHSPTLHDERSVRSAELTPTG
jgi:drug/metabolite transporter (DMT)-like permease